jgi:hypothetical protein
MFFMPFWVMNAGFALAGCSAAVYFLHPDQKQIIGAAVGGTLYGLSLLGQYWAGFSLGWWRSRIPESQDPLRILSVPALVICAFAGTILMLILLALGRRFGWKAQLVLVALIALGQPIRERIWFTIILPVMTVDTGSAAYFVAATTYFATLVLGLLVARIVGRPKSTKKNSSELPGRRDMSRS